MQWLAHPIRRLKEVEPVRLIVSSFFLIIVAGTFLLCLPASSRSGRGTPLVNALFTATSATCVTGLVVYDTWTHFSTFGQVVILALIQVGGLGLVTFTTGFTLLLRRKLGLRDLQLAQMNTSGEAMNTAHLIRMILSFTFGCEGVGALLLMIRFVPKFGARGIWVAVFESISAYCNAGFDILGFERKDGSLTKYVGDPLVCLVIAFLIIIGGLGFVVISDIYYAQLRPLFKGEKSSHLAFHTRIVLWSTGALLLVGTLLFFVAESDNTMRHMDFWTRLNASFFQSVSARTAGFATIDIHAEHDFTKIVTVILMFIGASPASTGGGIKTTTMLVLSATVFSVLRGSDDTTILKRRVDKITVYRSLAIFAIAIVVILITTGIILGCGNSIDSGIDALFEATSGFGTVGLTTGITPILDPVSKVALVLTMFIGRVGPVSLGLSIAMRRGRDSGTIFPEGKIIVG